MNDTFTEAERLNQALDQGRLGDLDELAGFAALRAADLATPEPNPAFVAALRASVIQRGAESDTRVGSADPRIGIVAFTPRGAVSSVCSRRTSLYVLVAAVAVVVAFPSSTYARSGIATFVRATAQAGDVTAAPAATLPTATSTASDPAFTPEPKIAG